MFGENESKIKSMFVYIENPTVRQWILIMCANFVLWLICRLFKNDDKRKIKETKEVVKIVRSIIEK